MGEGKLRTGVLGLDRHGQAALEALTASPLFEVVALADQDMAAAGRLAEKVGVGAFDDYRQFILQNTFDCLIICARLYTCLEHVRMALKKKTHVLKWAPMARTFPEADELAALATSEGVRFDVANPQFYCPDLVRLGGLIPDQAADRPFLIRGFWEVGMALEAGGEVPSDTGQTWMTDKELAGGGVLLYEGYGLIDRLVRGLGVPQQVYCLTRSHASTKAIRYLAEDVALLSLRFGEGLIGDLVLVRHWDDRPGHRELSALWRDRTVCMEGQGLVVRDAAGGLIERVEGCGDPSGQVRRLLADYAASHSDPEGHPFAGSAGPNLQVMAVMEAAYLSAQTGSPESPDRLLDRAGR